MLQRILFRFWAAGGVALFLALSTISLRAQEDAAETTFDRNADREWSDVNGVSVTGRFSGVIRDEVLINVNGRVQRVKLSNLSEADIAWLWGLHNQEGKLDQLPIEYRERPETGDTEPMPDDPLSADPGVTGDPASESTATAPSAPALIPLSEEVFDQQTERVWTVYGHYIRGRLSGIMDTTLLLNVGGQVQRIDLFGLSDRDLGWCWEVYFRSGKVDELPTPYDRWSSNPFRPTTSEEAAADLNDLYIQDHFQFWINGDAASIHGRYTGISDSAVTIADRAGATHSIALDDLSLDEVAWIRGFHAHHGTEADLPERLRLHADPLLANAPGAADPGVGDLPEGMNADEYFSQETYRDWTEAGEPVYGGFASFTFREEVQVSTLEGMQTIPFDDLSQDDVVWLRGYHAHHGIDGELPERLRPRTPNQPGASAVATLRDTRTWTDRDGKTTQGSFSSIRGEEVSIFAGHGVGWVEIHLAQLSRNDLVWLQEALKNEGRIRELPLVFRDSPEGTSEADLVRMRRQGGLRQWRLYNNQTFGAAFDYIEDSIVHVMDNDDLPREEHWNDLSDADHEYLKERLGLETAAEFFPAQQDLVLSPADQSAGMRVWTDREGNQVVGTFKHLTAGSTVAVFDTADGEGRYIYEYISGDDQAVIQGVHQQNQQQIAQGGGGSLPGYSSNQPGYTGASGDNNGIPGIANPVPGYGPMGEVGTSIPQPGTFNNPGTASPMGQHSDSVPSAGSGASASGSGNTSTPPPPPGNSAYDQGKRFGEITGKTTMYVIIAIVVVFIIRRISR